MSKPESPQDFPYSVELTPADYYWCSCGKAKSQPFCDGSHKNTDFEPFKFSVTEKKNYTLCGCKKTKNPPYCDGSHNKT